MLPLRNRVLLPSPSNALPFLQPNPAEIFTTFFLRIELVHKEVQETLELEAKEDPLKWKKVAPLILGGNKLTKSDYPLSQKQY